MTIANELRAECARILARNFGLPNELAAIRIATVQRIDAYVSEAEDRAAACTCQPVKGFEIDTTRAETPAYAAKRAAKVFGKLNVVPQPFRITARHNAAPYRILEEIAVQRMLERA